MRKILHRAKRINHNKCDEWYEGYYCELPCEDELTSCREAYGRLQQNIIKAGEYVIAINKSDSESDAGALALAALSLLLNDPTLGRKYRRKFL